MRKLDLFCAFSGAVPSICSGVCASALSIPGGTSVLHMIACGKRARTNERISIAVRRLGGEIAGWGMMYCGAWGGEYCGWDRSICCLRGKRKREGAERLAGGWGRLGVACSGVLGVVVDAEGFHVVLLLLLVAKFMSAVGTRRRGVSLSLGGTALGRFFGRVRRGASCSFSCHRKMLSGQGSVAISTRGGNLLRILGTMLAPEKLDFDVRSGSMIVVPRRRMTTDGPIVVGKGIASTAGRPLIKIAVQIGGNGRNAAASVSNGCSVRLGGGGSRLRFSCVNCGRGSVEMGSGAMIGMLLSRSDRVLGRMITVNCNIVEGESLANSMTHVKRGSVGGMPAVHLSRTLANGMSNMRIAGASNRPNTTAGVLVHNNGSVSTDGRPLCIMSKFVNTNSLGLVSPGSVRSVRVLGSTTTASVCNTENTGNIIVVAAGEKARNNGGIAIGTCINVRRITGQLRVLGTHRCTRVLGRRSITTKRRPSVRGPDVCRGNAS